MKTELERIEKEIKAITRRAARGTKHDQYKALAPLRELFHRRLQLLGEVGQ